MKNRNAVFRTILMMLLVCGVMLPGAMRVQAATKKASQIPSGTKLELTEKTTIEMDQILNLPSITGNYELTIKEVGPSGQTHPLNLNPGSGNDAINVKSLRTEGAVINVMGGAVVATDAIDLNEGSVKVIDHGGYGLRVTGINQDFKAVDTDVTVECRENAIEARWIYGTKGTWKITSSHETAVFARAGMTLTNVNIAAEGDMYGLRYSGTSEISGGKITATGGKDSSGAAIYSVSSPLLLSNTNVTAVGVQSCGINVQDGMQVQNSKLSVTADKSDGIVIYGSSGASFLEDSDVTISCQADGIDYLGSAGTGIAITGGSLDIQSGVCSLYCESGVTVNSGTIVLNSKEDNALFVDGNVELKGGNLTATGKLDAVVCGKKLTLSGGSILASTTAKATDGYVAIKATDGISYYTVETFLRQPAGGKTKKTGSYYTVVDADEKAALTAELIPADMITEIRYEFPIPAEGETPSFDDIRITTKPENALNLEGLRKGFGSSVASHYWESKDGSTTSSMKSGAVFVKDCEYYTSLPDAVFLGVVLDMAFTDNKTGLYYNRGVVQGISPDLKVYINGADATTLKKLGGATFIGKALPGMKAAKIADIPDQELSDKPNTPEPEVTYGGKALVKGTDFAYSYKDNTKVGTATLTITGKGAYGGTQEKTFKIVHTKCTSDGGRVTRDATVSKKGEKTYKCKYCGKVLKTEEIPVLKADAPMSPDAAPTVEAAEKEILNITTNKDPASAKFNLVQAKAKKITNTSVTLGWTKVKGAQSYIIYGNKCKNGNKYLKLTTVKGSAKSKKITKIDGKKLKKGTYYKFIVAAVAKDSDGNDKVIAVSKSVHFITTGNKKYGDYTKVQLKSPKTITLKKGKKYKLRATQVKPSGKKVQEHRKLSYESTNVTIAKVDKKGKITAKKKGKATIYIYAQNGVFATIKVTVK